MTELASIGKMVSIFFAIVLYACSWIWAIDHQKDCNRNAKWEVLVARVFIGIHIIALGVFFIWSWNS